MSDSNANHRDGGAHVTVALESHFARDPSGAVYGIGPLNRRFWDRYLEAFDRVTVLARVRQMDEPGDPSQRADGDGVSFIDVPDFYGPSGLARTAGAVWRTIGRAVDVSDRLILRVPGTIGSMAALHAKKRGKPFALEVVGDPWDALAPGTVHQSTRRVLRGPLTLLLRVLAKHAVAAAYVTRETLQRRYPPSTDAFSTHYSSIELPDDYVVGVTEARAARIRDKARAGGPWKLGYIGTFNVMYKAPHVHLQAVAHLRQRGLDVQIGLLGDGHHRQEMEQLATDLGLGAHARFYGQVPAGDPVMAFLDDIDLFVIASLTEGLPRALIEAMARGCPAVGSHVGGIPELLEPPHMVPPDDARALANTIASVLEDPDAMMRMAHRNITEASTYVSSNLQRRRRAFYEAVLERTA